MGAHRACVVVLRLVAPFALVFSLLSGCQMASLPSKAKLAEHREMVDESGLTEALADEPLRANLCLPAGWQALKLQKTALYSHRQWRSPSRRTAVGVTYIRMPMPLSTKTVAWFAAKETAKRAQGGKITRQWTDSLGREWFEGENSKYHMVGYVMTRGLDAWINYCGYRVAEPREAAEYDLARRSLDTVMPLSAVPVASADRKATESSAAAALQ